jgi:hypothetical protein
MNVYQELFDKKTCFYRCLLHPIVKDPPGQNFEQYVQELGAIIKIHSEKMERKLLNTNSLPGYACVGATRTLKNSELLPFQITLLKFAMDLNNTEMKAETKVPELQVGSNITDFVKRNLPFSVSVV